MPEFWIAFGLIAGLIYFMKQILYVHEINGLDIVIFFLCGIGGFISFIVVIISVILTVLNNISNLKNTKIWRKK